MSVHEVAPKLLSWGSDVEDEAIRQAARCARLPFIAGHVALMPDAHAGIGATVGSVIPTQGAIIPAAVGVDIGCGMVATETSLTADDLPDNLDKLMPFVEVSVPAGVGKGHSHSHNNYTWLKLGELKEPRTELTTKQRDTMVAQFGSLGSGNHFAEICLDERDHVWTVLHSGSRGIGNQLAMTHIDGAKSLMKKMFISLEDPDLAYFVQGTPEFDAYIADMLWAQAYAMGSREVMAAALNSVVFKHVRPFVVERVINCHHNFTQQENHGGKNLWITRKGAIKAAEGDWGVIPGSMGTKSYIVKGKGAGASYNSCSHGAGRRMPRNKAKRELTIESLEAAMAGKSWNADKAATLLDEHPDAYKDIDQVMEDQRDLVEVQHTLRQVFNYKGV